MLDGFRADFQLAGDLGLPHAELHVVGDHEVAFPERDVGASFLFLFSGWGGSGA